MSDAWDGRPQNPERDGWHWVIVPGWDEQPVARRWNAKCQAWGVLRPEAPERVTFWRYLGPCLTPAEVAAAISARGTSGADALAEVRRQARREECKRIATWIEAQRNDVPATGAEFAAAIRARMEADDA